MWTSLLRREIFSNVCCVLESDDWVAEVSLISNVIHSSSRSNGLLFEKVNSTKTKERRWRVDLLARAPFIPPKNPSKIDDPPFGGPIPAPIDRSRPRAPILRHAAFVGFTSSKSQSDEPEKVRRSSDDDQMQKYLLTIVQFFDSLRGTKTSLPRPSSLETLKTHLDKQMQAYRTLDSPSSSFTRRALADQVDQLVQHFSSENPSSMGQITEPALLRLQAFLERTSEQLKTTIREKSDLKEKLDLYTLLEKEIETNTSTNEVKRDRKTSSISIKEINPVSSLSL